MGNPILGWGSLGLLLVAILLLLRQIIVERKREGSSKIYLLAVVALVPVTATLLTNQALLSQMKEETFCGSCHIMQPFTRSLENPEDSSLATRHSQHRWIGEHKCYTCHTDYDILGGVKAKVRGLRHLIAYYSKSPNHKPKLYKPFLNAQCLSCHSGAKTYEASPTHQQLADQIQSEEMSCLDCHGPAHPIVKAEGDL